MPLLVISAREAFQRAKSEHARWPGRTRGQMGRLRPVAEPGFKPSFRFSPEDLVFTIGSCFARNIERQLLVEGYNVALTRFSPPEEADPRVNTDVMLHRYVPQSIANELAWALTDAPYPDAFFYEEPDGWRDLQLHMGGPPAPIETIRARRTALTDFMRLAGQAKVFVMTVGLAEAWFDRELGLYLNASPPAWARKLFPDRFEFHLLDHDEVLQGLEQVRDLLVRHGQPDLRMLVTVSPVALATTFTGEDIIVANSYMKSALRSATEVFARRHEGVDYFPSYESVMLTDYRRAWQDDQAHVTDEMIRRNVLRMLEAYGEPTPERERALAGLVAYDQVQSAREAVAWERRDRALELYRSAAAAAPEDGQILLEAGKFMIEEGRWTEALGLLEAAIRQGSEHYGGWYWLARVQYRLRRYGAAWTSAEEARRCEPRSAPVLNLCADVAAKLGRTKQALELAEQHASLEPGSKLSKSRVERLRRRLRFPIWGRIRAWLAASEAKAAT
jgi:tetratricopeptide (TPR) repeat protein